MRTRGMPIGGDKVKTQTLLAPKKLKCTDFKANNGWLTR